MCKQNYLNMIKPLNQIEHPAIRKELPMLSNAPMYMYATEMVGTYYEKLGIKGNKLLTVCGSGDQVLNAFYFGAREIVAYDINQNALHVTNLKMAALKLLTYREFLKFFGQGHTHGKFDYLTYKKLSVALDKTTKAFFDEAFKKSGGDGDKLMQSDYFRQRGSFSDHRTTAVNAYLNNRRAYQDLQKTLPSLRWRFIRADVHDLPDNQQLNGQEFDIINLSNMLNYLMKEKSVADGIAILVEVVNGFKSMLAKNGRIFYYSYSASIYPNELVIAPPIAYRNTVIATVQSLLQGKIAQIRFSGMRPGTRDKVVVIAFE